MRETYGVFARCLVILGILTFLGCESQNKDADTKSAREVRSPYDHMFVNGSAGLPSGQQWRNGVAFYDMNGDGNLDIVSTPPRLSEEKEKVFWIWYGNGKGEWTGNPLKDLSNSKDLPNYGSIAAGDFNGDNVPDFAAAMHGVGMRTFMGTKDGRFENAKKGLPSYQNFPSRAVTCGDFNNDGLQDIAALTEYVSGVGFFESKGLMDCFYANGRWNCKQIWNPEKIGGLLGDVLVTGDVNGDGNLDLGVASRNSRRSLIVWRGDGKGDFVPFNKGLPTGKHYSSIKLKDFNKDGFDDALISVSGPSNKDFKGVKIFLGGKDGFTEWSDGLPSGDSWSYFASAGDLNGDGDLEVVCTTREGGLKVYQIDGNHWKEMKVDGLPEKGLYRIFNIYCLDVNKDGLEDIAILHANAKDNTGGIKVFLSVSNK
jgi:hypothetical protein